MRRSQFDRNMGAGSIMALIGAAVSVISYPIYLHYLGYHQYGLWLVLSVVVSAAQLGSLGIPWALMKLVAEDHGRGDWEGVRAFINTSCGLIFAVGIAFFGAVIVSRKEILSWFKLSGADAATVYSLLPYIAMLSLLVLMFSTFNAALGGLGRMDLTSYNEALAQILVVVFSGAFLYFRLDLRAMVVGAFSGYLVAQVASFIQVQRAMPIRLVARTRISRHKARQLLGTGGWILANGVSTSMLLPLTRLMLSRYSGLEAVAVTDMCLSGSLRVRNVFDAAFRPMMPEVSGARARDNSGFHGLVRSIDRKAFLVIFAAALPTFIGLIIVMNPLLHLWLHKSFNPLLPNTFRISLIGAFISLLGSSAYYMLIGIGNARDVAYAAAVQLVANAAVLMTIAFLRQRITVEEAAAAFGIATACATLFLRMRISLLTHTKDNLADPFGGAGNDANSPNF